MRIKKMLGNTRQYKLDDGRIVSIEDFRAGRVPENIPQQKITIDNGYSKKKSKRWE